MTKTIYENIKDDQVTARKERNASLVTLLSTIIGEMNNEASRAKSGDKTVSDEVAIKVLKSFSKNLDEIIRLDQDEYDAFEEKKVVDSYLPQQMTESDLRIVVENYIAVTGKNSMKDIMAFLKGQFAGLYDGKAASTIAKEFA